MIISHKYKFIFIKTNKTAGTSVEIALSKICGDDDIITKISPEDEKLRKELGYRGAQHHKGFYNHISAREIKNKIDNAIWDSYFKFCFERNPWDRFVSFYYWHCRDKDAPPISEFVDYEIVRRLKKYGIRNYTIDGAIAVDRVCRYEALSEELNEVGELLGFPEKLVLPRTKNTFRKDRRHYREILDPITKAKIEKMFADECRLFGYSY